MAFTMDNTQGFSPSDLAVLNRALAILLDDLEDDEQMEKFYSDRLNNAWLEEKSKNTVVDLVNRVRRVL